MILFEIHQKFKGHFLNELRVAFKTLSKFLHEYPLSRDFWKMQ